MKLQLRVRTPLGILVDREVRAVTAEDLNGWFGIRPGRAEMVAALPAGLLSFQADDGESFVALAGGLLDLRGGECRVMARDAVVSRDLSEIGATVERLLASRRQRGQRQNAVLSALVREALRRVAAETSSE